MDTDIRDRLRMVIKEKGFSQAAIAYKANLTPSKLLLVTVWYLLNEFPS